MKDASKKLGKKFASGCSIVKDPGYGETLVIQGDVSYDVGPYLTEEFGIPEEKILEKGS